MIDAIRSEFRKLLTVRSTYFIVGTCLLIVTFFAGFIEGYQAKAVDLLRPDLLASESTNGIVFVGLIFAFAGLLLLGHEYRYSTIMYTLTSTNRRAKVLLAKVLAVSVFAVVVSLIVALYSPAATILGAHLNGMTIGTQHFNFWEVLSHCMFVGWGYSMYALILIAILRNQIGAIITFLLVPLIGENILALLLKSNAHYLPFTALQSVAAPTSLGNHTTPGTSMLVVLVYVAVGLLVSFVLFIRRDAN